MPEVNIENKTDRELLLELVYRVNDLREDFERISNGVGFPRCQLRQGKIELIETRQDKIETSIAWWRNSTIGAMFMVIVSLVIRVVTWDW